ncbi:MAG: hypothetical protein AcusKO_30690 [Acuticoccus sp.]
MSEQPIRRRNAFEAYWPWPGVPFTALLALWCFYMGTMSDAADLGTAFYGLGAVLALVALLGLRAANVRRAQLQGSTQAAQDVKVHKAELRNEPTLDADDDDAAPEAYRTEIPAAGAAAALSGAALKAIEAASPPSKQPEPAPSAEDAEDAEPDSRAERRAARQRRRAIAAEQEAQEAATVSAPVPVAVAAPETRSLESFEDVSAAIQDLEQQIARERAERYAPTTHLGEGEGHGDLGVAIEERLNNHLTIAAFNAAMAQKVFPRVEAIVRREIRGKIDPDAVMEKMGQSGEGTEEDKEASFTFALQLAEARQALEAHIEEMQKDRKELRNDIRNTRRLAERAVRLIEAPEGEDGAEDEDGAPNLVSVVRDLRADHIADRARLGALETLVNVLHPPAADGARENLASDAAAILEYRLGQRIDAVAAEARGRIDEAVGALDVLRKTAGTTADSAPATPEQVGAMRRQVQVVRRELEKNREATATELATLRAGLADASERLESALAEQAALAERLAALSGGGGGAAPGSVASGEEVDSLRQALTTIIDQNRAIRDQQERLSARLDGPDAPENPAPDER